MKQLLKAVLETVPENFDIPKDLKVLNTSEFVKNYLTLHKIPFREVNRNIFSIKDNGKPLLSAHMDSVGRRWPTDEHIIFEESPSLFSTKGNYLKKCTKVRSKYDINIGADDRAGVALILACLKKYPDINFIFSRQEEISPHSVSEVIKLPEVKKVLKKLPYCLVLDRNGSSDIIGADGKYCEEDFIKALEGIEGFNFKSVKGSICDADQLSVEIPSVNLSVGYYSAHSDNEYIIYEDWINTFKYILEVINTLKNRFELKKPKVYTYGTTYNSNTKSLSLYDKVDYIQYKHLGKYYKAYNVKDLIKARSKIYRDKGVIEYVGFGIGKVHFSATYDYTTATLIDKKYIYEVDPIDFTYYCTYY